MTEWIWPNHDNDNLNNWTWPKLKPMNLIKPANHNFTSRVLLTSMPDIFLVEEQRHGASKAGQVSLWGTCPSRMRQHIFGGKLMFVGVMNFGQNQKIMFVVVNIFWSNSNQFLVILILSSKFAYFVCGLFSMKALFSLNIPFQKWLRLVSCMNPSAGLGLVVITTL